MLWLMALLAIGWVGFAWQGRRWRILPRLGTGHAQSGGVVVAVVDSGIDVGHPEFAGRIADARSFVGGDVLDREGHGMFVAGIVAAAIDNNVGIAGIAFPAQLLVAKVVRPDGTISPEAEARGIRWAVDAGARVINLSLGGSGEGFSLSTEPFQQGRS